MFLGRTCIIPSSAMKASKEGRGFFLFFSLSSESITLPWKSILPRTCYCTNRSLPWRCHLFMFSWWQESHDVFRFHIAFSLQLEANVQMNLVFDRDGISGSASRLGNVIMVIYLSNFFFYGRGITWDERGVVIASEINWSSAAVAFRGSSAVLCLSYRFPSPSYISNHKCTVVQEIPNSLAISVGDNPLSFMLMILPTCFNFFSVVIHFG